jgi:PfaD family protein
MACVREVRRSVALIATSDGVSPVLLDDAGNLPAGRDVHDVVAVLPPIYPEWLGDRTFTAAHGVRFPYIVGEMARGIATPRMVIEGVRAGAMAFFGSAGLGLREIEDGVRQIQSALGPDARRWGANLIHSPQERGLEMDTVDLLMRLGVRCISASAFMRLTPSVAQFAARGLTRRSDGVIVRANCILAKVSRAEVARQFLEPPPAAILQALVAQSRLTAEEADLAALLPVAEDVTAEADSGGHTDNRPLTVLLPGLMALRDEVAKNRNYEVWPRIGAAGGLGVPAALAAAFAAGAAYVITGSINQSAVESGVSADARAMLANARSTDVAMAPAADMFEIGARVQVLKRGAMFAQRGQKLSDFYRRYASIEEAPADIVRDLEVNVLGRKIDDIWADTEAHFLCGDPAQIARANTDPRHRMALIFRWYLFMGAQWAREGVTERRADYQIWCGPAMGAFNDWVRGSFLEPIGARTVKQIALNLLEGAAVAQRAFQMRSAGVALPPAAADYRPRLFA